MGDWEEKPFVKVEVRDSKCVGEWENLWTYEWQGTREGCLDRDEVLTVTEHSQRYNNNGGNKNRRRVYCDRIDDFLATKTN